MSRFLFPLLMVILLSSACQRESFRPFEDCDQVYTLVQGENLCPQGMMFEDEEGQRVFVDMHIIDYSGLDISPLFDLETGDQIAMTVEELDKTNWAYHLIEYICWQGSESPSADLWTKVTCVEVLKEQEE